MLWLQTPPWGRWLAAGLIVLGSLWVELRPAPSVEHPFASEEILAGAEIGDWNIVLRRVPAGLFEAVAPGGMALTNIAPGEPLLASTVGEHDQTTPAGWWSIEMTLPISARPGDQAQIVLLDAGSTVPAVVVAAVADDPLGSGLGIVAVPGDQAADVAAAAVEGRAAIMIATG